MSKKRTLRYIETEGGPFILLPMERKKCWTGTGDPDDGIPSDYERAEKLVATLGVLDVDAGQALILGTAEVTAYWSLDDGGVFIQRIFGDEDADVIELVEKVLQEKSGWTSTKLTFDPGAGKLALFDSAYAYADSDEDERLKIALPPGKYRVESRTAKTDDVEVQLVRLRSSS